MATQQRLGAAGAQGRRVVGGRKDAKRYSERRSAMYSDIELSVPSTLAFHNSARCVFVYACVRGRRPRSMQFFSTQTDTYVAGGVPDLACVPGRSTLTCAILGYEGKSTGASREHACWVHLPQMGLFCTAFTPVAHINIPRRVPVLHGLSGLQYTHPVRSDRVPLGCLYCRCCGRRHTPSHTRAR